MGKEGTASALRAGVDTSEHGDGLDEELMDQMIKRGVYWCPTLYVGVYVAQGRADAGAPIWLEMMKLQEKAFRRAVEKGVNISFGTDAGGFSWSVNEAKEFGYMVKYGMTPMQAIRSATVTGAELLGEQDRLGPVEPSKSPSPAPVRADPQPHTLFPQ